MDGTKFYQSLGLTAQLAAVEDQVIREIKAGNHAPLEWVELELAKDGHACTVAVAADAVMLGTENPMRVCVTHRGAQRIADHFDASLPTTRLSDLAWKYATARLTPCIQQPVPAMSMVGAAIRHDDEVTAKLRQATKTIDPGPGIKATVGKDWVLTNRLVGRLDKAANYGWHDPKAPNGKCWQPLGLAHNLLHADYSQVVRLVRRRCLADGRPADLFDLLQAPLFAPMLSDEGVLRLVRHPGVAPDSVDAVEHLTPDVTLDLKRGDKGSRVAEWQQFLSAQGHPLKDDGDFGPKTEQETKDWQAERGLPITGVVDEASRSRMHDLVEEHPTLPAPAAPTYPFVQARHYTKGPRRGKVDLVVLHTMESPEKPGTAQAVANWFAGESAPQASAHFCVDAFQVVQCVKETDIAWHAPGANNNGIGVEHAGYARQSEQDWEDAYSTSMLRMSATLVAGICRRHSVPVELVDAAGLVAGKRGITTHAAVSKAFKKSDHTDPGANFPSGKYLELVRQALGG